MFAKNCGWGNNLLWFLPAQSACSLRRSLAGRAFCDRLTFGDLLPSGDKEKQGFHVIFKCSSLLTGKCPGFCNTAQMNPMCSDRLLNTDPRKSSMDPNHPSSPSVLPHGANLLHMINKICMLETCQCSKDEAHPNSEQTVLGT